MSAASWSKAQILAVLPDGAAARRIVLRLEAPPATVGAGQVVEVAVAGAPHAYFALASTDVQLPVVELVAKRGAPLEQFALDALASSDGARPALQVRGPIANEFPWRQLQDRPLIAVGTGTAMAPLCAALSAAYEHGTLATASSVDVLYGVRDEADAICAEAWPRWKGRGVQVHLAVSRSRAKPDSRARGYVYDPFRQIVRSIVASGTVEAELWFCGHVGMGEMLAAIAAEEGIHTLDAHTNYE